MMTYRDLKNILSTLNEEQLSTQIFYSGDSTAGKISEVWITEEDQINPTGEGLEPVSFYSDDKDFDLESEFVVFKKGTPILILT